MHHRISGPPPACALCGAPGDYGPTDPRNARRGLCQLCLDADTRARVVFARRVLAQTDGAGPLAHQITELRRALAVLRRIEEVPTAPRGGDQAEPGYDRCQAAHADDPTACEGPWDAVRVVDRHGAEALGCVHHGARLLASIRGGRVYYVSMPGAAIDTYNRAQVLPPFPWIAEAGR